MNIEPIDNGCIRIWMGEEEAAEWGLSTTRTDGRRLSRLVRRAMVSVGRRPGKRMAAEMIPVEGGWLVLVSPHCVPDATEPAVYHLPDGDALLLLREQWCRLTGDTQEGPLFTLYEQGEGYDLAVYPSEPLDPVQLHLLLEYGSLVGYGAAAVARAAEYGTPLMSGAVLTAPAHRPPDPADPPH